MIDGWIFCQVVGESEIWRLYAELTNSLPGQTADTQQKVGMWKSHLVYIKIKMYNYLVLLDKVDMEYEFIREFCFPGFTVSTEVAEMFDTRIKLGEVSGQM